MTGKKSDFKDFLSDYIDDQTKALYASNLTKMNKDQAHVATLRDVGTIMFGSSGLAVDYLEHFLAGSGEARTFALKDMLAVNPTADRRIRRESRRRVLNIKTELENRMTLKEGRTFLSGLDPCITVYQRNFDDVQWWGALGTFRVNISHPVYDEKSESFHFSLDGRDRYRWAPEEGRPSQPVHKIAQYLIDNGLAKEFDVIGTSLPLSVRAIERIFTLNQNTNPRAKRGVLGSGFEPSQIARSIYFQYMK